MDLVTGAHVAVEVIVPVSRERMWDLITDIGRVGEWSPEALGGLWLEGEPGPYLGARFVGRNRYADGFVSTVNCVITEAGRPRKYAWDVLDDSGEVGSTWRYELRDGGEPGTTVVHHSFTHGPGITGAREGAEANPEALNRRLVTLCRNMTTTIAAMAVTENAVGATQ